MRRIFVIAAVVLQLLVLGFMAGEREWILHTGRTIWLRTAPIDPRDVMRGDYARLEYEIGQVHASLWRDGLTNRVQPKARSAGPIRVYAWLRVEPDGLAQLTALSDRKPNEGLFLRGRFNPSLYEGGANPVRYGLEAFFMEQGKAQELENERTQGHRGVPLRMEVAVGAGGIGVIKGYRWEALGIAVDFDTVRRTNRQAGFPQVQSVIVGAKVELKNHGDDPVAIVDLPDNRSFGLISDVRWQEPAYRWVGETNRVSSPAPSHVILLQPGQSHTNHLDLTGPEWFVADIRTNAAPGLPQALQQLTPDWNSGFRIEYRPPPPEACATLPNAKFIWHGRLRSRWFNPMGNVD